MSTFFLTTLRQGLRGHSFRAVFILGLMLIAGSYLASMFSPRQPETVALDVGFSVMRFSLVLLAIFWVQDLVGKEIERRTTVIYLANPIPRSKYILGRFIGIATLLLIASITLGLLLWIAVMSAGDNYAQSRKLALGIPFWLAILALWVNIVVVSAFTLCIASLSTIPALPLALGAAFSIAAQSLGAVIDYLARGADGQSGLVSTYSPIIEKIRWVLPDLSRLDWRTWPMYDSPLPLSWISWSILMAGAYIVLLLAIAIQAFSQREFD